MWNTLSGWFKNSLTITWARFLMVGGVVIEYAAQSADFMQAIGLQNYVPPKYIGFYTLGIAIVTELARRRTLK